ncbi:mucin-binding protein [Lactiplantibacillus plantarum]|uniref:mucin-binding protein n=1 Tax=Lactiplantibacillus plantarum TaxID=1590 RepID=UPI0021CB37D1|nr:LPXTG cell wall anchor domain-containing protein [Lactiplantibacillus plantarum]
MKADTTSASSSSAAKAETASASSSSAAKAETTSASSSSVAKAETTSASSSSAAKAETTSASSSSVAKAETTSASSSSAAKAETTSASSSSVAKAETTSASSSSAAKAEMTSASNSSAAKAETTSASSSSAAKAETTSASSSSAAKAETTSASSSSAAKAETTSASSSSAAKAETTSAGGNQIVAQIATNVSKNDAIVTTKFAQNYGRWVLAGSVTNTGFSVSDPDYPSGMWIDPDKSHYSYEWLQAKYGGNQIVFSTNRTGDGIVYVTELSASNKVLKQYTLNQNTQVTSAVFDSTTYYNDAYFEMVRSSNNSFVTKYTASKFDSNYYNTLSYFVPKLITQTTYYVDKDGKQITDSNGNPVVAYTQKGLVGQNYTTSDVNVVNGYYAIAPSNSNGVMSPYGEIGASYVKNFHNGVVITYTQTGSDGTMSASIALNGKVLQTWTNIKPSTPTIMYRLDYMTTYGITNPYIPQTSDIKYVYSKLGNWVVSNPDGSKTSIIYPNDPSDPTKIADSSVPDYPVIHFLPGYTPEDHMGTPLVPVNPDDRTKGYIPPIPSDNGTDTTITYTADKQKGSVSYVDDTTGTTLKTDSISGTTGSKSSYSTSGSIADYKKQGYELVTDGYPADLTFDNDDTTDQNFTVHLKHQNIQSTEAKTVTETIHYQGAGNQTPADNTAQVTFTRQVSTDAVTGEKTYGSWSADQSFAAVTSPVIKGYTPDQAEIGAQTVSGDASDLDFTVVYTKDAPTKPVNPSQPTTPTKPVNPSQPTTPAKPVNPSQPTTPTKPVNPSQPTTPTKPVQAGQAAATNFVNQRLPQTDETDQQHMTLSGLLLLAMSSLLGLFGMTKRQRKE